jgi:hypothetical protein
MPNQPILKNGGHIHFGFVRHPIQRFPGHFRRWRKIANAYIDPPPQASFMLAGGGGAVLSGASLT